MNNQTDIITNADKKRTYLYLNDHVRLGKGLRHFVYPAFGQTEITGFEDGLRELIPQKLKELLRRCSELEKANKKQVGFKNDHTTPGSVEEFFLATFAGYEYSECYVLQKWLSYWLNLWYHLPGQEDRTPHKVFGNSSISETDIQHAKEMEISPLYEGKLRKVGTTLVGLCPFHQEKTPSFTIYLNSNTFYCFGCQTFGDSISFIQKTKNLSFSEAVRWLL